MIFKIKLTTDFVDIGSCIINVDTYMNYMSRAIALSLYKKEITIIMTSAPAHIRAHFYDYFRMLDMTMKVLYPVIITQYNILHNRMGYSNVEASIKIFKAFAKIYEKLVLLYHNVFDVDRYLKMIDNMSFNISNNPVPKIKVKAPVFTPTSSIPASVPKVVVKSVDPAIDPQNIAAIKAQIKAGSSSSVQKPVI